MAIDKSMRQKKTSNSISLEVDLDELFGVIVPDNTLFRQAVGQAIIDKIRSRAQDDNAGVDGGFSAYSPEYKESDDFKIYGKSEGDVNLTASGDMLNLMDIIEEGKNKIIIGWNDSLQSAKAHGHVTGSVGKKRNFLGLRPSEVSDIREMFEDQLPLGDAEEREENLVDIIREQLSTSRPIGVTTIDTVVARNFLDELDES